MNILFKALTISLLLSQAIYPAAHIIDSADETEETSVKTVVDYNKMLIDGVNEQDLKKVKLAINNKASVESTNAEGKSPLALACQFRNPDIVNLLLKSRADISKAQQEFNDIIRIWNYHQFQECLEHTSKMRKLILANLEYHQGNFDLNSQSRYGYYELLKDKIDHVNKTFIFFLKKSAQEKISKSCSKKVASCFRPFIENPPVKLLFWSSLALLVRSSASASHFETMKDDGGTIIAYIGTALVNAIYYGALAKAISALPEEVKKIIKSPVKDITLNSPHLNINNYVNGQDDAFGMNAQMWLVIRNELNRFETLSQACTENGISQDPTATNINDESAIMLAIKHNRKSMMPILKSDILRHFKELQIKLAELPSSINNLIGQYLYGVSPDKI